MKSKVLTFVENATREQKAKIIEAVKSFPNVEADFAYFDVSLRDKSLNQGYRHNVEAAEKILADLQKMGNEQPIIMAVQQAKKMIEATKECRACVLAASEGSEEQRRHARYTSQAARSSEKEWDKFLAFLCAAKHAAFAKEGVRRAFEGTSPNDDFEYIYRVLMLAGGYNYANEVLGIDKWLPE